MIGIQSGLALSSATARLAEHASNSKASSSRTNPTEIPAEIRRAADGFESLFVSQLLAPLEQSSEAMFGTGPEGRMISGLYTEQLSASISQARPLGVATMIEKALLNRHVAQLDTTSLDPNLTPGLAQHAADLYRKASS